MNSKHRSRTVLRASGCTPHWAEADADVKAAAKADAAGKVADYTKVMKLLDPIVDEIIASQHPELKNNPPLARGILDNDLRASIQLNKLDRTRVILNGYKQLATGDSSADAGAAEVLKQLVVFIPPQLEELKHKTGPDAQKNLANAKEKFGVILEETIKPLTGAKLTPKLIYFTSQIYSSMDNHKAAADLLEKVTEPAKNATKTDVDLYQTDARAAGASSERRLAGETEEARKVMDEIMGEPKTRLGPRKVDALMENAELAGRRGQEQGGRRVRQRADPEAVAADRFRQRGRKRLYLTVLLHHGGERLPSGAEVEGEVVGRSTPRA